MADLGAIGLGSNNALNSDLIAKLKKADEGAQLGLYERGISSDEVKLDNLSIITNSVEELKASMEELGTKENYNAVNVSGNETIDIKVTDSSVLEDFSLEVTQKARKGIVQSNTFTDLTSTLTTDQTFVFSIGSGADRTINFSAGDSYEDVITRLNLEAGIDVSYTKINDTEYRLTMASEETGVDNAINIKSETTELTAFLGFSDPLNEIQTAQNSKFIYNGLEVERSDNNIKDVVPGIEFTIAQVGTNNISLNPNSDALLSSIDNFVEKYNTLVMDIKNSSNVENYTESLMSNSEVRGIMRSINDGLFGSSFEDNKKFNNLTDLGITSNKDGTISIGTTVDEFGDEMSLFELTENNFDDIRDLFSSTDALGNSTGIMNSTFDNVLDNIVNDSNTGSLNELKNYIDSDVTRLNDQIDKTQLKLDAQYELMTKKFAAFDSLIQQSTNAFASLQMQIDQSTASPS
jgi:flagellar hook-associated protein 2